jgi:hypothetical protein
VCVLLAYIHLDHLCASWPERPEKGFLGAVWVLGTKPGSSARATRALNWWAISLRPGNYNSFFFFWDRVSLYSPGCPVSLCRPGWPCTLKSACLCLPSAGTKGMHHHTWLVLLLFKTSLRPWWSDWIYEIISIFLYLLRVVLWYSWFWRKYHEVLRRRYILLF